MFEWFLNLSGAVGGFDLQGLGNVKEVSLLSEMNYTHVKVVLKLVVDR